MEVRLELLLDVLDGGLLQVRVLQNLVKALDDDGIVFFLAHLRKFVSLLRYTGGRTDVGRALKTRMRPNARRSDPALTRRGSRERIVTKTPVPKDRMATRLGFDDPPSILTWQRVNSEMKKFSIRREYSTHCV